MDDLEQLLAREAIRETKARYCRLLDTKRWDDWGLVFTPDVVMDVSEDVNDEVAASEGAAPVTRGRQVVVDQVRMLVGAARTVHQVHAPEIRFTSSDTAEVVWAMEDWVTFPDGVEAPFRSLHGYGHYHEVYKLQDGAWRIAVLKLTRLQQDFS